MIRSIRLKNFQSHKDSELEFCDGLNVISGSSDAGKSSIMRAFRWLYENRPSGDTVVRHGENNSEVSIQLDKDLTIEKTRISGKASYSILNGKIRTHDYSAMRTDVPTEITTLLDLAEQNVQSQHDPYFLLNNTPGEVAKKLNDLVGLSAIDKLFRNLNSKTLEAKRKADEATKTKEELTSLLADLEYVPNADKLLASIEKKENQRITLEKQNLFAQDCAQTIRSLNKQIDELSSLLMAEKEVKVLQSLCDDWNNKKYVLSAVTNITTSLQKTKDSLSKELAWLEIETSYLEVQKLLETRAAKTKELRFVQEKVSEVHKQEILITQAIETLEHSEKQYKELLEENKICPLCGSEINDDLIRRILT